MFTLPRLLLNGSASCTAVLSGTLSWIGAFVRDIPDACNQRERERFLSTDTKGGNLRSLNGAQRLESPRTRFYELLRPSVFHGSNVRVIAVKAFIRITASIQAAPRDAIILDFKVNANLPLLPTWESSLFFFYRLTFS